MRSSLLERTIPTWLSPAHRSLVLTGMSASRGRLELQKYDVRQSDPRLGRQLHFHVFIPLLVIDVLDAGWNRLAVHAGAQPAQILDVEIACGGVAPQARMF